MSPLFHRAARRRSRPSRPPSRRAEAAERAARAAESLERIEQGRIPLAASERLARFDRRGAGEPHGSVQQRPRGRANGARSRGSASTPITQVMGSSIYHVGWQPTYYNVPDRGARALGRLQREPPPGARAPARGGADGRRRRRRRRADRAGRSRLGGRRGRVHRARHRRAAARGDARPGRQPCSPTSAARSSRSCAKPASARSGSPPTRASTTSPGDAGQTHDGCSGGGLRRSSWANQELVDFSQGVYEAREKAMARQPRRRTSSAPTASSASSSASTAAPTRQARHVSSREDLRSPST